jgi:predicted CopG family antitoxin
MPHTHGTDVGSRNISISDEAYSRLAALKGPNESFTDVINQLAGRRSILELVGVLTEAEGGELRRKVEELRFGGIRSCRGKLLEDIH